MIMKILITLYIVFVALIIVDTITTHIGLKTGCADEGNPIMKKYYKIATIIKLMIVAMIGIIIWYSFVAWNNITILVAC